jgi:hypothetical protein
MKRLRTIISAVLFTWAMATAAQAVVIDFSEVSAYTSNPTILGTSFWAGDPGSYNDTYTDDSWTPGNPYLASGRDDQTGNSPGMFDTFIGVSLAPSTTSFSFDILSENVLPGGTTLWVQAFQGATLKGSGSVLVADNLYHSLSLNVGSDIDKLFIFDDLNSFNQGESFHIDNFTTATGAAPVPEPSTMLLMVSGLAGAIFWRKRKTT